MIIDIDIINMIDITMIVSIDQLSTAPQLVKQPFGSSTIRNIFLGGIYYDEKCQIR